MPQQASVGITNALTVGVDMFAGWVATNVLGFPAATQRFGQVPRFTGGATANRIEGGLVGIVGLAALVL